MKILIVGQYYYPDNFLINEISEELVKRGHHVTMLTGLPDYSTNVVPKEYRWFKRHKEIINGVNVIRVPIIARHKGFIFRVLNYLSFMISSSIYALTHKFEADVIMAYQTAPVLMANAALILKKKLKKPLFFYCLDIWPDQMKVWNVGEKNIIFQIVKKYCQYAYGRADVLGITSEPFKEYMININKVSSDKIKYVPQHAARLNIQNNKTTNDMVNLIFAGNIGQQQNVECILKAIPLIETKNKFHIHIYGDGTSFAKCKKLAIDLDIMDRVTFYGRVSKKELEEIYCKMDAFLLTLCGENEMGYAANTVPAKFQGYLSAGKPILASIDGGAKDIIEKIKCGRAVKANDHEEYAKIISDFIDKPTLYINCGKNGINYFNKNYDKIIVMDEMENILLELFKRNK